MAPVYNTIHIILHQLHQASSGRFCDRYREWQPKRRRRCVSAGGRQETVRAGDPAPVTDPPNGEEWQAHILGLPRSPANVDQKTT
jgi:hypothetical protein